MQSVNRKAGGLSALDFVVIQPFGPGVDADRQPKERRSYRNPHVVGKTYRKHSTQQRGVIPEPEILVQHDQQGDQYPESFLHRFLFVETFKL